MNEIEQLIDELCPECVEFKGLGKVSNLYGGLTEKSRILCKPSYKRY